MRQEPTDATKLIINGVEITQFWGLETTFNSVKVSLFLNKDFFIQFFGNCSDSFKYEIEIKSKILTQYYKIEANDFILKYGIDESTDSVEYTFKYG